LGRGRQHECFTSAFLDLAVEVFAAIGGSQTLSVGFWEGEDGKASRELFLCPSGKFGLSFRVGFDEVLETLLGVGKVIGIENNSDVVGDFALRMLLGGDGFLGVLLGVELATLSRSAV
jgi:hypothetical protein